MSQQNTKTPAMVLQEFTVSNNYSPPEYVLLLSKSGTHENEFHFKVNVADVCGIGFGRSKQVAKHLAASHALELLAAQGLYDPSSNPVQEFNAQSHRNESDSPLNKPVNFIGSLKEASVEFKLPYPVFTEISDVGLPHCRKFTCECKIASITTQATANTKKQAKQLAAKDMLEKIKTLCPEFAQQCATESNALAESEKDQEAVKKYNELSLNLDVFPNKAVLVKDYTYTIRKIMFEKNLFFDDFVQQFKLKNKEGIDYICNKLDIKYKIELLQENPPLSSALFGLDTPFTIISTGTSKEDSENNLIQDIYSTFEVYMDISENEVDFQGCNVIL